MHVPEISSTPSSTPAFPFQRGSLGDFKLSPSDPETYYGGGAAGYVDYPTATEQLGTS